DKPVLETARPFMHGVADPRVALDGNATAFQSAVANQFIEHVSARAARKVDDECRAAEFTDYARDVDAATAGIIALSPGPNLSDRAHDLRLGRFIDRRIEG